MPIYQDILDRRIGVNPSTAIAESQSEFPASFPYARWTAQQRKYEDYWNWATGRIWEETIRGAQDKSGNPVYKFPLQVNLIKTAAMKHSAVVFGEVADGPEPLVPIRVTPDQEDDEDVPSDGLKKRARQLQHFLNDVWTENNGRTLQLEGGVIQQFLGGIVYKLTWEPLSEDLENKIKIEMVIPDFFMPVWDSTNPDNLLEAFLIWRVPAREAYLKYGYSPVGTGPVPEFIMYVEHWTKDEITITLGGKPLEYNVEVVREDTGEVIDTINKVYKGEENPFGFIPMVYIPRERAGGYYGLSIVDDLRGLAKEINARMADIGDSLAESSHREIFVRNVGGTIRQRDMGGLRTATDLGQQIPNADQPDAFAIDPPNLTDGLVNYPEILRKQFLRDAFLSSVAEGEDEGSQRSALTLAFRMYPLTSKARVTRSYWEVGLIRLNRMIAKIAIFHGVENITPEHLKDVKLYCEWAPMIPRDREQMVNEITLLLNSNALSPRTALEILGTVQDPSDEIERVKEWLAYLSEQQMKQEEQKQKVKMQVQTPAASTGLDNK